MPLDLIQGHFFWLYVSFSGGKKQADLACFAFLSFGNGVFFRFVFCDKSRFFNNPDSVQ
jgi:hypothetical protein